MKNFSIKAVMEFFEKHGRHISSGALFLGFIFDYFTLSGTDKLYDNLVFIFYLSVVAIGIFILNAYEIGLVRGNIFKYVHAFSPTVIQFAFGGLFSGFSIFYLRSASFAGSILFFVILFGLLIGNEFLREKYKRLVFQISVFFFTLFSYAIFSVPTVMGSIGHSIFLLSGAVSLVFVSVYILILSIFIRERFLKSRTSIYLSIGIIFVSINVLYFFNIIPPIPLVLKESGVYHQIYKNNSGEYVVKYESKKWYEFVLPYQVFRSNGGSVYIFSAVFSPTKFETPVVHHWQYFDPVKKRWISLGKIEFKTVGGRDGGYRGYSQKSSIVPGRWRVDVETKQGKIIGRIPFEIEQVSEAVQLKQKTI